MRSYEVLGLRDFFTAVAVLVLASGFGSAFGLASPAAFLAADAWGRAALGFASADATSAAAGAGSGFSSTGAGRGASFFTFFAGASSSADGAGAAAGCSPLAITSPL